MRRLHREVQTIPWLILCGVVWDMDGRRLGDQCQWQVHDFVLVYM